ncbi:G-type lectin S-receptor-like serine/threonine-protein kinase At4g27290 [Pistacia vera]|uniref:G-type lectin S-receptor-like serine/threonine-protein kinase At4g27290 n=1 Tax=Pistacia vera TaxID=55513 RepID=UPI001262D101|nr:G-type lectin S-receptor-like serine/threonine-protein kinase At4g27290 [Pistacia vera]
MFLVYYFLFFVFGASNALDTIAPNQSIKDGQTLVSARGIFELGFFNPGNSSKRYLGIWYKKDTQTVAWVANRVTSLSDLSGILNVTDQGNLVLLDGKDRVIWSSNISGSMRYPVLQLLDSGNLVVKDRNDSHPENFLWQSFDHPCDTLLPGMKLGRNFKTRMDRFLSSWKSTEDPAPGQFSVWIDSNGFPQLVLREGAAIQYRAGSWNGVGFTGTPALKPNDPVCDFKFVLNENEVYYKCDPTNSLVSRLWVNQTGSIERLILSSQRKTWLHAYSAPVDQCDNYSLCGANARCETNSSRVCSCLEGFVPKSPEGWSLSNWTEGCVRRGSPLDCKNGNEFKIYAGFKLPDTSNSWFNTSMSVEECREMCLRNCSCTASANSDISKKSGCLLWFGDLVDMRLRTDVQQDLFIRMVNSEQDRTDKSREVGIIVGSVGLMAILMVGLILFIRKKKLKKQGMLNSNYKKYKTGDGKEDMELWVFDIASIAKATDNFSSNNKLGQGGFGPVYKGTLQEGQEIAVKRLSKSSGQGIEEFKNEVTLIAKLQHRNLVKLLGCCIQEDENMLIYEYMPNKSLDFFIFDQTRSKLLDWLKRIHIIGGIARGMLYLHQDSRMRIIHRDLKASNVLLDNDMNPKISDFGMARIFGGDEIEANTNKVVGTYGYMSPEYAIDGVFSMKSDVFSFGVLVLEIVSGKKNRGFSHPDHYHNLLGHAWILWKEERRLELAVDTLGESRPPPEVLRYIHVGLLCVQQRPEDRPSMSSVVLMLGSECSLPDPKQPGFFSERNLFEPESSSGNTHSCTTNELTLSTLEAR